MKIHAVMYRDPDEPSELTVFLDGEPREVEVFDFDPGAGHNRFDIEKQRDDMRKRTDLAPGVRDLCEHHYARVLASPYTTED